MRSITMNQNFDLIDLIEFKESPENYKKNYPQKFEVVQEHFEKHKGKYFQEYRYPEGLDEEFDPKSVDKFFPASTEFTSTEPITIRITKTLVQAIKAGEVVLEKAISFLEAEWEMIKDFPDVFGAVKRELQSGVKRGPNDSIGAEGTFLIENKLFLKVAGKEIFSFESEDLENIENVQITIE